MTIRYINTQNQKKKTKILTKQADQMFFFFFFFLSKKNNLDFFFLVRENIQGRPNALLSKLGRVPRFYSPE